MLAGELYDARDPDLVQRRIRARRLTRQFNASREDEEELRGSLLAGLLGGLGTGVLVEPPFYCDYGSQIHVGHRVAINFNCVVLDCAAVRIGDHALLGPSVQIYTADHPVDPAERRRGLETAAPVAIGENAWLGGGVIVCPGVTIGADTTVGAGSVVVRDLPPGVLAVGNPCRAVRRL
jgi:maltose O-acetyltransferase